MRLNAAALAAILLFTGCASGYEATPPRPTPEVTPAPAPEPEPTPAPAPTPAPEPREPDRYGDDPYLDGLWDDCADGVYQACEDLYWESPVGSRYEEWALDKTLETAPYQDDEFEIDAQELLALTWNTLTTQEQRDLCDGADLFGPDIAGALIAEASNGTVTPLEAEAFLRVIC